MNKFANLPETSARDRAELKKQTEKMAKQITKCRAYDQIFQHIAEQTIEIDLDHGVKLNHEEFQGVEVPRGDGKGTVKMDFLGRFRRDMTMQEKWYQKIWLWLCILSVIILGGVSLFMIYLYRIQYISFADMRFLFTNENGNYDWGIFWAFVGAVGSVIVALLALRLSKKLGDIQLQQYELEAMPFIMIGDISLKPTSKLSHVEGGTRRFDGFSCIDVPYFTDNLSEPVSSPSPKFFEIQLLNTSKTFSKVDFDECLFENNGGIILNFNQSTCSIKNNSLFLEQCGESNSGVIGFVFADNFQAILGSEVKLNLILRNSYGDAYKQLIHFYCMAINGTDVMYELSGFSAPEKMKQASI